MTIFNTDKKHPSFQTPLLIPAAYPVSDILGNVVFFPVIYYCLASTARKVWFAYAIIHGIITFTTDYKTKTPIPFIKPILPLVVMRTWDYLGAFLGVVVTPLYLDGYDAFAPWFWPAFVLSFVPFLFILDSHPEVIGSSTSEKKKV